MLLVWYKHHLVKELKEIVKDKILIQQPPERALLMLWRKAASVADRTSSDFLLQNMLANACK